MNTMLSQNQDEAMGLNDHGADKQWKVNLPDRPARERNEDGWRAGLRRADLSGDLIPRFARKIHKTPTCWLWTGTKERNGYGQVYAFRRNGRWVRQYAHRVAYAIVHGFVPSHLDVMHTC